ncbi:MAG: hypothetical protein QG575_1495 [Euryarchaeota archaeon]|nr:hypothetical protein [Euryarchaeota archaeon]
MAQFVLTVTAAKRVHGDLMELAARINALGESGFRLLPIPREVFTEIDAILLLTGAEAEMLAAG